VGSELDLTLSTRFTSWPIASLIGYSHFFAGSYIQQTGTSRDVNFFYVQAKYIY